MKNTRLYAALQLLEQSTRGSFDPWDMAGPRNAKARAAILTELTGKRVPQSKSGVTEIRRQFHQIACPGGDHEAARAKAFRDWARRVLDCDNGDGEPDENCEKFAGSTRTP